MATQRVQIPISFSYQSSVYVSSSAASFVSQQVTVLLPASGSTVTIVDRNTGNPTTVYSALTGASTVSPVVTDAAGNVPGYVVQGSYTVSAASSGSFSGASVNWEAVRGDGVESIYPGSIVNPAFSSTTMQYLVPTGTILEFGGNTAPSGYVLCDGSVYPIGTTGSTYNALSLALGTTWNTGGEGGGNFRVPDLRGRTSIGKGTGSGLTARTMAQLGGEEVHRLLDLESGINRNGLTNTENTSHAHNIFGFANNWPSGGISGGVGDAWGYDAPIDFRANMSTSLGAIGATDFEHQSHAHAFIQRDADNAHNNMQPFAVVNKIIKL